MTRTLLGTAALLLLAGCPYLGDEGYTERVRDVDGDGFVAERFGGPDCRDDDPSVGNCDADGDGFRAVSVGGEDCDDGDAAVSPDGEEQCNGVDDDCDGLVDNDDDDVLSLAPLWHRDADGDSHGSQDLTIAWCGDEPPPGYVLSDDDCDDFDAAVSPTTDEICDDIDHDCDGDAYANALQPPTWRSDVDGDGFGDPNDVLAVQCLAPDTGAVRASVGDDCDPDDPTVFPGAAEVPYDGIDQDCDPAGADLTDVDGDGFDGGPGGTDCDDTRGSAYPGAQEVCNGADDDCDGNTDNGFLPDGVTPVLTAFWPDVDGDLRGDDAAEPLLACVSPANHVNQPGDCDDAVPTTYTGAPERCNNVDDDCDTFIDDDPIDGERRFRDRDSDLYGDPDISVFACVDDFDPAFNWVENDRDCDDTSAQASPVGIETCDGLDNDCNGAVDDGVGEIYYADADGDGFGNATQPVLACSNTGGELSLLNTDCNDADPDTNPAAPDICGDAFRQDCRTDVSPFDCDVDGFEDIAAGGTDCDDSQATVNPNALEVCDAFDNDCDGLVNLDDPSLVLSTVADWYQDLDQDGFGTNVLVAASACDPVPGASTERGDCNDADPAIRPDATERCDGIDNDCDDAIDDVAEEDRTQWYPDADNDGDGDKFAAAAFQQCEDPGAGYAAINGDCRDDVEEVSSLAAEVCDGFDNDCDALFDDDDDDVVADPWYTDDDGDGFGRTASAVFSCTQPAGTVALDGDCDDTKVSKNPGALEVCDALDNDCDGLVDDNDTDVAGNVSWVRDGDGDGYGADTLPSDDPYFVEGDRLLACAQPIGFVLEVPGREDCDDGSATVNPAAFEVCDGRDNDCNALADDDDANLAFAPIWYPDADDDGWGDGDGLVASACIPPADHVQFPGDCDDSSVAVNPLAPEICDEGAPLDNDCDGLDETMNDPDAVIPSWWPDADGDGFGDDAIGPVAQCDAPNFGPATAVQQGGDCLDAEPSAFPGAPERCNTLDDDCDGVENNDPIDAVVHWSDADFDGYGDPFGTLELHCPSFAPAGFVPNADDCQDGDDQIYPGAPERCDTFDNDCDGDTDEDPVYGGMAFAYDGDQDGWGDFNTTVVACPGQPPEPAALWVDPAAQGGQNDCDPANGLTYPGAPETCDGLDNDCNAGTPVDDGLAVGWFQDNDGDGFGDDSDPSPIFSCLPQPGRVLTNTDCDDSTPVVSPGMPIEDCDGLDNDCDGFIDDEDFDSIVVGQAPYWLDLDEDGYGVDFAMAFACAPPYGYANIPGDCDDGNPTIKPDAVEVCDEDDVDENCNGVADNADFGPRTGTVFLAPDDDGDGVGVQLFGFEGCEEDGLVPFGNGDDCNDADPRLTDPVVWRQDLDGDGYAELLGPMVSGPTCFEPQPMSSPLDNDCDDTNAAIAPNRHILVGPIVDGGEFDDLQLALSNACVDTEYELLSNYVVPAFEVQLPNDSIVHISGQFMGQPGPRLEALQVGVDAEIVGLDIATTNGQVGLFQSNGSVRLESVRFTGTGTGMMTVAGALDLEDVSCDGVGDGLRAACLEHTDSELTVDGLEATAIADTEPAIRIHQAPAGTKLANLAVRDAPNVTHAIVLGSNPSLDVESAEIEFSGGGLRIDDFGAPTDVTITRARIFSLNAAEAGITADMTPSSQLTLVSSLIYEMDAPGILDLSGDSPVAASFLTITGTEVALDLNANQATIDHAVFWNNQVDVTTPGVSVPGWNHNRFEHSTTASICPVGADCLDGSDNFVPDFIAYAPWLQPDLALPIPRVGGNLWNQDAGATDANGTDADLGFSGGPNGWTSFLYETQEDAIPDLWEEHFFLSDVDPFDDPDADGAPNEAEYKAGTHPLVPDTDGDGTEDGEELIRGCDPLDPASSVANGSCP